MVKIVKDFNLKKEEGSITIFVLIAILFFILVLVGTYMNLESKLQAQIENRDNIIAYYAKDIEEAYNEAIKNNIYIIFKTPDGNYHDSLTWTKQDLTVEIVYPEGIEDNKKLYKTDDGEYKVYTEPFTVKKKTKVYGKIMNEKEKTKTARIDKVAPEVRMVPNGKIIRTTEDYAVIQAQINVIDVGSGIKNIKYTFSTSNIQIPDDNQFVEIENNTTVREEKEEGTYYLWLKSYDKAGNKKEVVSNAYIVKEATAPIVTLKYNDANGENVINDKWTNKDIYTEIELPITEGNVEKYQYSIDGKTWKDVNEEISSGIINYSSIFPMESKPEFVGELTNTDGKNYIKINGNVIQSANKGISGSTGNSYIPIDLSSYSEEDTLTITLNAQVSSERNFDWGYICINNSKSKPSFSKSSLMNGEICKISGTSTAAADYSTTITGGKVYYIHIGYYKDGSVNNGTDTFTVNNVKLYSESLGKGINFSEYNKINNKVTFKICDNVTKPIYFKGIYTDGQESKVTEGYTLKIDKKAPTAEATFEFTSKEKAKIVVSNIIEKESGLKGYVVKTEDVEPSENANWIEINEAEISIENLEVNKSYYIYIADNAGNISKVNAFDIGVPVYEIDGNMYSYDLMNAILLAKENSTIKLLKDVEDTSTATFNKNITLDIQEYILTRTQQIQINSEKELTIVGKGTITSSTNNNTLYNNGTLNINITGKIESKNTNSSYKTIENCGILNINSGTVEGYYYGIRNYSNNAIININSGNVLQNYESSGCAVYNYSGKVNINGGMVKGYSGINYGNGNSYNIMNINGGVVEGRSNSGVNGYNVTINNGTIIGKGSGLNQNTKNSNIVVNGGLIKGDYGIYGYGNTKINGGRIEGKTYGIYRNGNEGILEIGDKEQDINFEEPAIYGEKYGVYSYNATNEFGFYNGVIMSDLKTTTYNGIMNTRENYVAYTYYDYNIEEKWSTILVQEVTEITIKQTPIEYTNKDVRISIQYPNIGVIKKQYSMDGINWTDTSNIMYILYVTENKTIYARTLDESDNVIEQKEVIINNIDKINPVVEVSFEKTKYKILEENEKVNINFNITATDEGVSGLSISEYAFIKGESLPTEYTNIENGKIITKNDVGQGNYYLWLNVIDRAGNISDLIKIRFMVTVEEPVAKIGDTLYKTIQSAVDACEDNAGETQTTIEILKDTDEETIIPAGKNIILDIQGHTIGSSNQTSATITNAGTLNITDTSSEKKGKIENLTSIAISNSGTLTLGKNDTSISSSSPNIYGQKKGIETTGTFNYYDGQITSKTPIEGNVTDTPEQFGPIGKKENKMTTVKLGIVSGYVVRIEWVYFNDLQLAINSCKVGENVEESTITMIKDILLDTTAIIKNGKAISLDLNGHILSVNNSTTVMRNEGKLVINDTSSEKKGKIEIEKTTSSINAIENTSSAYLNIISGNIVSSGYGIQNKEEATVEVHGGNITAKGLYTIHNSGNGRVDIFSGNIIEARESSTYNSLSSCIYNDSNKEVNIYGGAITSNTTNGSKGYVISNKNANATINVKGGTLYSEGYGILNEGILNIIAGEINTKDTTIQNSKIFKMTGGIITTNKYGVYNSGEFSMNSGKIIVNSSESTSYGIFNTAIVRLGDESNINMLETPKILVEGSALCFRNGNSLNEVPDFEIYDVYFKTKNLVLGMGKISRVREGFELKEEKIDNYTCGYIQKENDNNVVEINGVGYKSLKIAIDSIENDIKTTIKVIGDFTIKEKIVFPENKNIVIDLNNYTITNKYYEISNYGNLEIKDSGTEGILNCINIEIINNYENGNLIISSGTYKVNSVFSKTYNDSFMSVYGIKNDASGKIEINGGLIDVSCSNTGYSIYNKADGIIKINSGEVRLKAVGSCSVLHNGIGYIEINGGKIYSNSTSWQAGQDTRCIENINGNIVINGGSIKAEFCAIWGNGIYNQDGRIIINDIEFVVENKFGGNSAYMRGIENNYKNSYMEINGGNFTTSSNANSSSGYGCSSVCIENTNEKSTLKITGGTFNAITVGNYTNRSSTVISNKGNLDIANAKLCASESYNCIGISNTSTGKITLGIKGDGLVSENMPEIVARGRNSGYGISNATGNLYFYDGTITGSTSPINYKITEIEEDVELKYSDDGTNVKLTTDKEPIVKIGETTYTSIQEAINDSKKGDVIEILKNITHMADSEEIIINEDKDITLDLCGFSFTSAREDVNISNDGILTIEDSSVDKTGIIKSASKCIIKNKLTGILNIKSGKIMNTAVASSTETKSVICNIGTLNTFGGNISIANNYCIGIDNLGSIDIKNTEFNCDMCGYIIYNKNESEKNKCKVSNAIFNLEARSYGIYNLSSKEIDVNNATFNSGGYSECAIYNKKDGTINIKDCIFRHTRKSLHSNATGGTGIYNENSGTINIEGIDLNYVSTMYCDDMYGIYNKSEGTVNLKSGNISLNTYNNYSNAVNIETYGVYNKESGTINLGNESEEESKIVINILSKYDAESIYGVYNPKGNFNYYNGEIISTAESISGKITKIREKTEIKKDTVEEYEKITLQNKELSLCMVNGEEYYNFQEAINSCGNEESNVKILRDATIENIEIKEGQNITLDLNGYNVETYCIISNLGIFKIDDTSEMKSGIIVALKDKNVINYESLEFKNGKILGKTYGIYNSNANSIVTVVGGSIEGSTYGIYNANTNATVNITGGTIKDNTYGIYNAKANAQVNLTGGNITDNTYGIYNAVASTQITVTNANIAGNTYGIYLVSGTANIMGTFTGINDYGIYNAGGTINILENSVINSTIGIYNSNGTINVGTSGGTPSTTTPIIMGETYGIQNSNNATLNFYDGKIMGKTSAVDGWVNNTESGYTTYETIDGEYKVYTLGFAGTEVTVAEVNGVEYSNLQSAIDTATDGNTITIKLVIGINNTETYSVEAGQNIILDMNGYTITSSENNVISNAGNLQIIDTGSTTNALVKSTSGVAVNNTGTLTLGTNDSTINGQVPKISGVTNAVVNTGTFNFYDGLLEATGNVISGLINNKPSGYTVITQTVDGKNQMVLN